MDDSQGRLHRQRRKQQSQAPPRRQDQRLRCAVSPSFLDSRANVQLLRQTPSSSTLPPLRVSSQFSTILTTLLATFSSFLFFRRSFRLSFISAVLSHRNQSSIDSSVLLGKSMRRECRAPAAPSDLFLARLCPTRERKASSSTLTFRRTSEQETPFEPIRARRSCAAHFEKSANRRESTFLCARVCLRFFLFLPTPSGFLSNIDSEGKAPLSTEAQEQQETSRTNKAEQTVGGGGKEYCCFKECLQAAGKPYVQSVYQSSERKRGRENKSGWKGRKRRSTTVLFVHQAKSILKPEPQPSQTHPSSPPPASQGGTPA
jgi:hypothetical protein